jgi:hypothetical protein
MTLSNHFKHSLKLIAVVLVLLFGAYGYLTYRVRVAVSSYKAQHDLPANVKGRMSFNENTHILTVVTKKKTVREYARNPIVTVTEDDKVIIERHVVGFENQFFLGVGYSDCGRVFIGDNFYHVGRFDLFGTLGIAPDTTQTVVKVYAGIGYNVWSNTSLNIGIDPVNAILSYRPAVAGFVSVRF